MCGPKFCSMKLTQEIKSGDMDIQLEMAKKSTEFLEQGSKILS